MCFEMHRNTREARAIQVVLRGLVGDDRGVEEPELRLAASLMLLTNPELRRTNAGFPIAVQAYLFTPFLVLSRVLTE